MPELVKSTGNLSLEEPVTPADSIASDNFQLVSSEGDDMGSTSKSTLMPAASTVDSKPAKHGYTGSLKVLIVEDNLVNRNLLVQAVKATGVPHMEALDGGAAVEVFQKWQPTHGRLSSFGEWVER
jgi:PleD family two-component response regulator